MRNWLTISLLVILPACTAINGPVHVIDPKGYYPTTKVGSKPVANPDAEIVDMHYAFQQAMVTAARDPNDKSTVAMRDAGMVLTYTQCDRFFRKAAHNQMRTNVVADVITTLATLSGGALALVNWSNDNTKDKVIAAITLGAAAGRAMIDINTRNFLFGAENVDNVRDLTLRAMTKHQQDVNALGPLSYGDTVINLVNHQNICTPRHVALMVKEAISAGQFSAGERRSPIDFAMTPVTQDDRALEQLGLALGDDKKATPSQAGAVYAFVRSDFTPADRAMFAPWFNRLPADKNPFTANADGSLKGLSKDQQAALRSFSQGYVDQLAAQLDAWRAKRAVAGAVALPDFETISINSAGKVAPMPRIQ